MPRTKPQSPPRKRVPKEAPPSKIAKKTESGTRETIQVVKLIMGDGSVAHFTGTPQIEGSFDLVHCQIFNIEDPLNMVAEALSVCRNTLQTIKKDHLSDAQRIEMLDKAITKLDNAGS